MNSSQRLLLPCAVVAAIILCLIVPFRARNQAWNNKNDGNFLLYGFAWDPPLSYKPSPGSSEPYCPDAGPSLPAIAAEFLLLGFLYLGIYQWLGREDKKLENYPGYQRGF
jgi:hypothetical protein